MRPLSPVSRPEGRVWSTCRVGGSKLLESRILDGFVVALFVVSMWHQVAASLGGSLATDVAVGWGLAIGAGLGLAGRGRRGWLLLGLAVWSAVLGGLLSGIVLGLSLIPIDQLVTVDGLPVAMLVTTSALSLPLAWSVRLGWLAACRSSRQLRSFLFGTAIGAVMAAHLLFGWIGVDSTVLLAAVISGILFLAELKRDGLTKRIVDGPSKPSPSLDWQSLAGLSILGVVLASLDRMLGRLA